MAQNGNNDSCNKVDFKRLIGNNLRVQNRFVAKDMWVSGDAIFRNQVTLDKNMEIKGALTVIGTILGDVTGTVSTLSNHTTNDLIECVNALYYTDERARASVSAKKASGFGDLVYDNTNGELTFTGPSVSEIQSQFEVVKMGGAGDLEYNNGVFTHTGVSPSDIHNTLSAGTGIVHQNGVFSIGQPVGITDQVQFQKVTANLEGNVTGTVSTLSNHSTDVLSEGGTNQYFTVPRARASVSGGTGVGYDVNSGTFSRYGSEGVPGSPRVAFWTYV